MKNTIKQGKHEIEVEISEKKEKTFEVTLSSKTTKTYEVSALDSLSAKNIAIAQSENDPDLSQEWNLNSEVESIFLLEVDASGVLERTRQPT